MIGDLLLHLLLLDGTHHQISALLAGVKVIALHKCLHPLSDYLTNNLIALLQRQVNLPIKLTTRILQNVTSQSSENDFIEFSTIARQPPEFRKKKLLKLHGP